MFFYITLIYLVVSYYFVLCLNFQENVAAIIENNLPFKSTSSGNCLNIFKYFMFFFKKSF